MPEIGQKDHRAIEQLALVLFGTLFVTGAYRYFWRRRWLRSRSMKGPILAFLVVWATIALTLTVLVFASRDESGPGANVLVYVVGEILVFGVSAIGAGILWALGMLVAEAVAWLTTPDQRLTSGRRGHWVTLEECRAQKTAMEGGLIRSAPNVAMSALVTGMTDTGWLLGTDLYLAYTRFGQPWLWWDQGERTLLQGGWWWHDDPTEAPNAEFVRIAGPYLALVLLLTIVSLSVAVFLICPPVGKAIVGSLALLTVAWLGRHRLRASILASQSRR